MFVVNFVGGFASTHWLLKHHNTFSSYADTIMPQFFFAVGAARDPRLGQGSDCVAADVGPRKASCAPPRKPLISPVLDVQIRDSPEVS